METEADIVLLVNTDSDTVIFDKNADKHSAPASLTKIVTCILVLENCDNLDTGITCKRSVLDGLYAQNASTAGILAGETLTVRELLYCLMIPSAADAANMLADYIGGSLENFTVMMNDFVKTLGCENTNFINAHGLDGNGGKNCFPPLMLSFILFCCKELKFALLVQINNCQRNICQKPCGRSCKANRAEAEQRF